MPKNYKKITIRSVLGHILNILLGIVTVLIIMGVYYVAQIKVLGNDYANLFGYTFFEVATGSMSNTIEIGDVVIVKITTEVNKNDIIVYRDGSNFITHRLVEKDGEKLIAKGDANNSEDKPITEEQILGRVICIIPKLGIWRKVFLSPEVITTIVVFIVLLGIAVFILPNDKDKKEEKLEEKD